MQVSLEAVRGAQTRIRDFATITPLRRWSYLERNLNFSAPSLLKIETFQNTGSFKVRGAANKILSLIEAGKKPSAIIAASAGNHAQGVAFVAGKLGIPAKIVMPEGSPIVKAAATSDYGAEVILHGSLYDDAYARAQEILQATPGSVYVHAYEDPDVISGQGTMGLEIHQQLLDQGITSDEIQVIIPIGGGGLISGVGSVLKALRPKTKIFGVVSEAAPAMADSFKAGRILQSGGRRPRTIAEGLAVKKVSQLTFDIIKGLVEDIAIVDDDEVAAAISTLMERGKLIVEGAGAAGVAAILAHKLPLNPKIPTVFVLCGGNIDMNIVSNILERGFSKNGRWLTLGVLVEDRPGELARLANKIAEHRANVLEVSHDRIGPRCPVGQTFIRFQIETRGHEHVREVLGALESSGYKTEVLSK
jgi:threonine dehydratase